VWDEYPGDNPGEVQEVDEVNKPITHPTKRPLVTRSKMPGHKADDLGTLPREIHITRAPVDDPIPTPEWTRAMRVTLDIPHALAHQILTVCQTRGWDADTEILRTLEFHFR
jgi:hypothetical protein